MGLSGWDAEKAVKAQFGRHARIVKIDHPTRAQLHAEKSNKRRMSEDVKRSMGELKGEAKTSDRLRAFSGHVTEGGVWYLHVGCLFDNREGSPDRVGKKVGWRPAWRNDPDVTGWPEKECDSCGGKFLMYKGACKEREVWLCTPCRHENGFFLSDTEKVTFGRGKRGRQTGTRKTLGGMEFANEDLGTNFEAHGTPEMVEDFRRRGLLRKRLDAMGLPVTNLVCGSRKQQAELLKEFNRRNLEAQANGWKGTRSASGLKVHFLNHGGNTPGD